VTVAEAYRHCGRIAAAHYENFTVGSWMLPRRLRHHLAAIYAFARTADDFADEGVAPAEVRLAQLDRWERALDEAFAGRPVGPVFVALADTVRRFDLPDDPFRRLLRAFRADVRWRGFDDDEALLAYCADSANPVGHLVLYLFGYRDPGRQALADRICTGLQLANFWQDLGIDVARGRLYLPRATLAQFGVDPMNVLRGHEDPELRRCLEAEVDRAGRLLSEGETLAVRVDARLGREVRLFAAGGQAILRKIAAAGSRVLVQRPTLTRREKAQLALVLLRPAAPLPAARDAYAYCRDVTERSASNFAYAFRLLGPERRDALHAVYAFCRFVDDIADGGAHAGPAALLERWRDELDRVYAGRPTHPIGVALADAVRRFPLERRHFEDLIAGVAMDLARQRYETFEALYEYCYRVAATVGLLCVEIFGYRHPSARAYAVDLGIAFQLTNILRDVMEDAHRARVYLPLDDLRHFDVPEAALLAGRYSPHVGALMAFECGRARAYYLRARGALAAEDRASLAPAEAMRRIYERLLDRIEARHFDVFASRVTLPRYEKVGLALAAWGRAQLGARAG